MNPHDRIPPADRTVALAWALVIVTASVIGGVAGVAVDGTRVPLALGLAASILTGLVVAIAVLAPRSPRAGHASNGGARPAEDNARPAEDDAPQDETLGESRDQLASSPSIVAVLPVPNQPAGRDLSCYLGSTLIAQCPRCGAFELDAVRDTTTLAFRCQRCEHGWTWRPGTPWPPVQVRPRLQLSGADAWPDPDFGVD